MNSEVKSVTIFDGKREKKIKRNEKWKRNRYLKGMLHNLFDMNPDLANHILEFIGFSQNSVIKESKQEKIQKMICQKKSEFNLAIQYLKDDIIKNLLTVDLNVFYLIVKEICETVLSHISITGKIHHLLYGIYGYHIWGEHSRDIYKSFYDRTKYFDKADRKVIVDFIKYNLTLDIIRQNYKMLNSIIQFK